MAERSTLDDPYVVQLLRKTSVSRATMGDKTATMEETLIGLNFVFR